MTLTQLKNDKAALVAKLRIAKNPVTAPNLSPAIRQSIIDSNLKKYRHQITVVQNKIDILRGRAVVNQRRQEFQPKMGEAFAS